MENLEDIKDLLRKAGSKDKTEALAAQRLVAAALQVPLREGVLTGSIIDGIFAREVYDPNARIEYPIDLYRPDNDGEFVAYVIPNEGKIPTRHVEGDYITVPTFDIGAGIDFLIRYAAEANFPVVQRALEVLEAGFIKKMNDDGWHTILGALVDRNIIVSDSNATAGEFTKRLVSLMKLTMRRNAGGNSTSTNRGKLTHLYMSPEAMEDIRNWGLDQIDEVTRREIYMADDGTFNKVYGVTLVDLDELGESQEYQDYFDNTLSGSLAASDVELVVGLDLQKQDSFVMPVRDEIEVFEDENMHRSRRVGFYSWGSFGYACLNGTRVLAGSL